MKRLVDFSLPHSYLIQQLAKYPSLKVITPTSLAARALKVPHQSLETLGKQSLLEAGIRVAPILIALRLLHTAVGRVIQTSDVEGTTRALSSAVKAILRAGINPESLAAVSSNRTQKLALLAQTYVSLLRERGMIDPAEVLWQASGAITKHQPVLIYGYFHPRIDQLNFLNAIADDDSVMVLPCPESSNFVDPKKAVEWLQQQGWEVQALEETTLSLGEQLQNCFLNTTIVPPNVKVYIYPHLESEVRGALAQVKNLLSQGTPANEIVLVARDDTFYGPSVLDVAYEYKLPVRALYGVPLNATRLGAWVQLLLEVIQEKFPFELTARLLRHPLCSFLSAQVWQEARKQHPSDLLAWQGLGINLSLLDWQYEDTRDNWVERMQDVLNKFNLRQGAGRWAREIVAYYEFQEVLVDLSKPEEEVISFGEFAADVMGSLALVTVPAQPGRGGVELHTPLSLFGAKFRHVFVLGAVEGILPALVQDDPILDFYERKLLRQQGFEFEDAAQAARREVISFYALLQTPIQSLTFSYPQMIGKEATLPSPYLSRLRLEILQPPPLPVASLEEARQLYLRRETLADDDVLPQAFHAWNVEKRREGADSYDEYDGVIGLPLDPDRRVFSASQLTALGQCPFKWFANKVLKLAELEEAEEELSSGLRGSLYHRSLELALLNTSDLSIITENLQSAFVQAEQDLQLPVLSAWEARRIEHLKVLGRACVQPDFRQSEAEFFHVEKEFSGEWYGLNIKGVIDRIDRTPQGLVLLDYKTSSQVPKGIKDESGKANVDIQLPLYIHFASTTLFPGETVHEAYYYSVTKGKKLPKKQPSQETLEAIAQKIKTFLHTGYYAVEPDVDQNACQYCSYDLVCRKGSRQSRKGINL
ncbi:PD-(D/E)XK nuclease family protein [Nostoc sp. DedQUE09]|uniref:PD-(D/E)XK nuclease family protein n=1 Tax=Nostoc sp. DedQUE09 TaxID=3075394 RepID=UPI002AD3ECD2|nr:PD-(D/E)XK nuclease family protein [Nostoc sp. DedQUE09]MDZ7954079.1 PD-(D/E)XK nuclease family protein [Nostoc sp. DedQUE09]